jgi:D-alanyl-D-alanine carboxypeptidase/D-alanyl-D-alanine-endopeptidase (penicillin-binding protein 4)
MGNRMKFILISINLFFSLKLFASQNEVIRKIIKKYKVDERKLSMIVVGNENKDFELNSTKLMIPASLTKIATATTVLSTLPANFKFKTELYTNGKIEKGVLKGDLCFKGGGDPAFVSEKMWFLVNELVRNEFNKIDGNLVYDTSRFDAEIVDKNREKGRVDRAYDAPISPLSFNWNSVNVFVRPGFRVGDTARVFADPVNTYIEIENKTKTVASGKSSTVTVTRLPKDDHDIILLNGNIAIDDDELVFYKGITNPPLWTALQLKSFLKQRNIEVTGKVVSGNCAISSKKLASVDSKNINEIVNDMMKFSNNFVAEMLAKNLGAIKKPEAPSRMEDGIDVIKAFLESIGFTKNEYVLENVSGLTRENRFSALQISKLLSFVKEHFQIYPEFTTSLPIAGVDGTLKKRMKGSEGGIVRAKTGYLDGVIGLAGFIEEKEDAPSIFVFMFNGEYEEALNAKKMFDEIVEVLKK